MTEERIISNEKWNDLADALDDFLLDELDITIDAEQTGIMMRLITGILEIKKE